MYFIGLCPGIYFSTLKETKQTSVISIKTTKNILLVSNKYMNLSFTLIISLKNFCCNRKYRGIFVIFILLHEFF